MSNKDIVLVYREKRKEHENNEDYIGFIFVFPDVFYWNKSGRQKVKSSILQQEIRLIKMNIKSELCIKSRQLLEQRD